MVVVWLKRDLRLLDHEPLIHAISSGQKILLLYNFEPLWTTDSHYSPRHIRFIKQSLADMQRQLAPYNTKILIVGQEMVTVWKKLHQLRTIKLLLSYQETGMKITYDRDKAVAKWCRTNGVQWKQSVQNGVFRGLSNRSKWKDNWVAFINEPVGVPKMKDGNFIPLQEIQTFFEPEFNRPSLAVTSNKNMQHGGTAYAVKYLNSFLTERITGYNTYYSKPATSRLYSSRLSPYIAWGNLSVRQVCQYAAQHKAKVNKRNLSSFLSRMRWQAHFIQKFEMEGDMEFKSVNKGYHKLVKPKNPALQKAWRQGNTGLPLVDAAMRCLLTTGFVNFRLRAMLASFFTHLLWQPWQDCTEHLAQNFLDFEPGIHFPQLNMQSGETGVNTIRIYNPIKNGKEHDPEGTFIKKWVPELEKLPLKYIHEPWKIPAMEKTFLNFELGRDYPGPIVDIASMRKYASDTLYAYKKNPLSKTESIRIVHTHTLPGRPVWDQHD
ncbi:Deoxyribodipyrimidine photo-lyase [Croceitalea dokdonensis DOKDO 023]|uniref:Deoxyribodipyrimidine photo-lyase n=1 Tax=Croceitalea dokdonensis DOKDO 023 TaxID=1300341 RepID=A0A0P7AZP4_9FLAO|nr:FAD-binding domain-containing protein [Croceitalea dokdonensis]KPM33775.1 Deoxyribodipyrimidine photo-lyase [Croceitalea dokdonensis DOKDO 023]